MKRFIFLFVISFLTCSMAFAQKTFSTEQKVLRDKIMSFLKTEGFQPSIDSDGDIRFKRQGDVYFVCVSATDDDPMYVRLSKYFNYSDNLTKTKINLYAIEINQYKMIKLIATDDSFLFDAQLYLTDANAFTSIFYKILKVMDSAEEELK